MNRRLFLSILPAPFVARFFPPPPPPRHHTTTPGKQIVIAGMPTGPATVVAVRLYKTDREGKNFRLIATAKPDDSEWTFID